MRNFLKAFLVFLCWAALALFLYNPNENYDSLETKVNAIENKQSSLSNKKTDTTKKEILKKAEITKAILKKQVKMNANTFPLVFNDKFITNSAHTRVLLPKKFYYFKDSIFNFLNSNNGKEIVINAVYKVNEILTDKTNFGIARANNLKNKLVKYGINSNRITSKATVKEYKYDKEGYYADGVTILVKNISESKRVLIEKEISHKTLYISFRKSSLEPTKALLTYTFEIKNYLKKHLSKKITIIGHTDNQGNTETNQLIGLERANLVAEYFTKNGIDKNRISVQSKGETSPITNNKTLKARKKNRRIEVIIN
ncbi:OmpA family protein [Tenacibaculum halocynthiae]|uniref:OmpA family protein n=1 Tax=Tenacibaculum halocynthiae TaxID=1254437 RepID=UPI0038933A69